ncbi:unnamed protein product [Rhizoctonia solani]|uniref:F-box domain-containing protein n=1 Tax=Rhizoctonia solani TaxID=456999 RepID=A0A8H3H928_9AGAM|nr:unnamed protein product [Rhizoctonia solani]
MIPRDPSALKDWVADRIMTLENAETIDDEVVHPDDGVGADDLGFNVTHDLTWMFTNYEIEWTYVIDLDNVAFTINGTTHLRLDYMPPELDDYSYKDGSYPVPQKYLCPKVDLWPAPNFDNKKRQQEYEALQPIVVPATEWGAPTWDELTVSQRFSIDTTHYLLRETSRRFNYAYAPFIRRDIGKFCWNMLCASVPALPIFQEDDLQELDLSFRILSCGESYCLNNVGAYVRMHSLENGTPYKFLDKDYMYCWIRGCLVTFCTHLDDPIYVVHEVEKMIQRMRHDRHSESVGIILSSQQELVVVALDGSTVRHSPVLDIRTTPHGNSPGRATDGRLLLTYLLSPPLTVSPLPWRMRPRQPPTVSSRIGLPPEVLQIIIDYLDIWTYISMCRVSRSIRSVCIANPRVGSYAIPHRVSGSMSIFAARSTTGELKKIKLQWKTDEGQWGKWTFREVSPEEFDTFKQEKKFGR